MECLWDCGPQCNLLAVLDWSFFNLFVKCLAASQGGRQVLDAAGLFVCLGSIFSPLDPTSGELLRRMSRICSRLARARIKRQAANAHETSGRRRAFLQYGEEDKGTGRKEVDFR